MAVGRFNVGWGPLGLALKELLGIPKELPLQRLVLEIDVACVTKAHVVFLPPGQDEETVRRVLPTKADLEKVDVLACQHVEVRPDGSVSSS